MNPKLPQQFGQYTLTELIARGGMAEIYRATLPGVGGFEKTVAIKKILPHLAENEEFITMLIDEAQIIVSINHANIAQVYDLGKIDEDYYIAMEYIHGIDLSTIVKELKESDLTVPVEHAVFIGSSIVAGLHVAHNKHDDAGRPLHIVHRDVSPHNILISFAGDVKIIDFGVAKARGKNAHTSIGVIKGKLLYMAPEQAMAKPIDGRADLFAAGLILYRMLTNRLPFEGDNEFQIYNNILSKEITPPRSINPDIPEEVNQIVMMLLQRDPSKRYQDGYSAKVDLDRALHAISPGYSVSRLSRWVEDNFSHLFAKQKEKRRNGVESGDNDLGISTPAGSSAATGQMAQSSWDANWDAIDEEVDTINVNLDSPEAQRVIEEARRARAAAGLPPRAMSAAGASAQHEVAGGYAGHPPTASGSFDAPSASGTFGSDPYGTGGPEGPSAANGANPHSSGSFQSPSASGSFGAAGTSGQFGSVGASGAFPSASPLSDSFDSIPDFNPLPPLEHADTKRKIPLAPVLGIVLLVFAIVAMLGYSLMTSDQGADADEAPAAEAAPAPEAEAPADDTVEPGQGAAAENADGGAVAAEEPAEEVVPTVALKVTSTPSGAMVFQGSKELGVTPLEAKLPKGENPVGLRLELDGYRPFETKVIPFSDVRKKVELESEKPVVVEKKAEPVVKTQKKKTPRKNTRRSNRKKQQKKSEPAVPLLDLDSPPKKSTKSKDDEVLNPFDN